MNDPLEVPIRAVANSTRRRILAMVWRSQMSAGAIAEAIDLAPASVSEHLKVLRKAGMVSVEKTGTSWNYQADHSAIDQLIERLQKQFPSNPSPPSRN